MADLPPAVVSVIIVHYETPALLRQCLAAVTGPGMATVAEVRVIDNASRGSAVQAVAAAFPGVEFEFNAANVGFAAACNQGMRAGAAPYCLLLNPDAILDAGALARLVATMEVGPRVGAVAPRLVNPDGSLQYSCRRFPARGWLLVRAARLDRWFPGAMDRYLMRDWDHGAEAPVDWAMGACLLLRRQALAQVGWLDPGFFMYYEDLDLCYRLWARGWEVRYAAQAVVRHEHQRGSARPFPNRLAGVHLHSLWRLWRKHPLPWW